MNSIVAAVAASDLKHNPHVFAILSIALGLLSKALLSLMDSHELSQSILVPVLILSSIAISVSWITFLQANYAIDKNRYDAVIRLREIEVARAEKERSDLFEMEKSNTTSNEPSSNGNASGTDDLEAKATGPSASTSSTPAATITEPVEPKEDNPLLKARESTLSLNPATSQHRLKKKPTVRYDDDKEKSIKIIQDEFFNPQNAVQWEINKNMCVNDDPRACAIRALMARKWKPDDARILLQNTLKWRKEHNVDTILSRRMDPTAVDLIRRNLYDGFFGCDKDGYPVYYMNCGKMNLKEIVKHIPLQALIDYHVQVMEYNQKVWYRECSEQAGFTTYKGNMILDLKGFGSNVVSATFMDTMMALTTVDADYYFESLRHVFIINASSFFSFFWRTVRGLLQPETQEKFQMLGSYEELQKFIPIENIPAEYGGTYDKHDALCTHEKPITKHLKLMDEYIELMIRKSESEKPLSSKEIIVNGDAENSTAVEISNKENGDVKPTEAILQPTVRSATRVGEIHVICAEGLAKADMIGLSDPYCIVFLNDDEVFRTQTRHMKLNPVWDRRGRITFPRDIDKKKHHLRFEVYDADIGKDDDFLGCVEFRGDDLEKFLSSDSNVMTLELKRSPILPFHAQKFVQGKIQLSFQWTEP